MIDEKLKFENCIVLLMGFPGCGKKTVASALAKKTNIKSAHNHEWVDPILNLLGDDYQIMWHLSADAWKKLNAADDLILSTIADVAPRENSYTITQMMFAGDPYHKVFYDKILTVVNKRKASFFPVRLVCDETELARRVQSVDRKNHFKTMDVELSIQRSREKEVFHSMHANELTINNTDKSPDEVADMLIKHIQKTLLIESTSY